MKKYLTSNSKKNEIRLLFKHPSYKDKSIILVEGASDIRLFRSLMDGCHIKVEAIDGKREINEIVKDLNVEFGSRIAGIRDADFDNVNKQSSSNLSVFITDCHDAEMMMINSASLDSFISEYSNNENYDFVKESLRENVFSAAYVIGLIRYINEIEDLKLVFKSLTFSGFVNVSKTHVDIDISRLVSQLFSRSPLKPSHLTESYLLGRIEIERMNNYCGLQICCGHDVTKIIERVYSQSWVSIDRNLNQQKIESALRIGYSADMFKSTALYKNLSQYFSEIGEILTQNNINSSTA